MNTVIILGTLTRDVEVKYSQSGSAIASFAIATNDRWKDQSGQQHEKVHFFDITAFGKQGETINQYFRKGSRILIEGSLDYQSWTAQDGSKKSKVGIKLSGFTFVDKKSDGQQQQGYQQPQQQGYQQPQQQAPQATPQNNMDDPNRHNVGGNMNRPPNGQQVPVQQPQQQQGYNQGQPVYDENGQVIPI